MMIFDSINIETPKNRIYKRLGYYDTTVQILPQQKKEFESYVDEALLSLELKGVGERITISDRSEGRIAFEGDIVFESKLFSSLAANCTEVMFMAATAGNKIIEDMEIFQNENLTKASIYDVVASEVVDASLEWMQEYFNQQLKRENKRLDQRRISCGYGDFSIKYQKTIYDILGLGNLGIEITEYYMLLPEKSVTAVSGIVEVGSEK
ncbi:MAG: hypothetical protein P9M06_00550 [Candidatus Saelkia tenebricola]|nr:hypothetical protein [Candidatus Saelkia tenebricola]